jgi:hypothetical protein
MSNVLNQNQIGSINSDLSSHNHSGKFINFNYNESTCLIMNSNIISPYVSSSDKFKMTKESDELKKLNSEILSLENTVLDLKLSRKLKQIKVKYFIYIT